jgi:hypothetical protein
MSVTSDPAKETRYASSNMKRIAVTGSLLIFVSENSALGDVHGYWIKFIVL